MLTVVIRYGLFPNIRYPLANRYGRVIFNKFTRYRVDITLLRVYSSPSRHRNNEIAIAGGRENVMEPEQPRQCTYCDNGEPPSGWPHHLPTEDPDLPPRPLCQECLDWALAWGRLTAAVKGH